MKIFYKRSVWAMITVYAALWLAVVLVAGVVLDGFKKVINNSLGLTGYRTETVGDGNEDMEYFKSEFVKKDADGNVLYTTDDSGYKHQTYDDKALRTAALEKAQEVQKEGTTILWNSSTNGLPVGGNKKVSLFSHSSIDWGYSGGGSGAAYKGEDMKAAFTGAGFTINRTLWDFYKTGAGKDYVRVGMYTMNEVPWSVYTTDVKNLFASHGDAAIITFTRLTREGSAGGASADVTTTAADTPTGDYYDLSREEEDLVDQVIALKKAGTFKKVIVLLNTPTGMFMDTLVARKADIDCCMWVGQTGYRGLNEVAKILAGDSIPSGHLADTFLHDIRSTPAYANVKASMYTNAKSMSLTSVDRQGTYIVYAEGIYVGYKYYETRYEDAVLNQGNATSKAGAYASSNNWVYKQEVAFPFGYGASFTTFKYSNFAVAKNSDGNYEVTLTVKNTGSKVGADAVQVYVQKPYTEYDKQHGIEQSAVNLAGYAKTAYLEPGASEDVKIIVRDDAFKTYDADGYGTYIREKGTYYITAAQDAHEATNNILAAKGKTPQNTGGVMDGEGDGSFVWKTTFSADDVTTYSVSEYTNKPITNQFDDSDWNRYENKGAETVTYLSRKDWKATYPTTATKLSMTAEMVKDLAYNHTWEEKEGDVMPEYGATHQFNLIDLKGLEYDNPAWNTLLNQLTIDEQIKLCGNAYFGTVGIESIAKNADVAADGPLGLKKKLKISNENTVSYPSPTLLAASYNDKLAREVGEITGEEALHSGVTGIYSPGSNTHRSTYSSRNWEYHSEDGFLSGMIGKWRVIGMQSKGCYVNMKHFALNDQESYRHGVSIWANEQAIREIYLASYEYGVTEGGAKGMMSAFNRIGTKWSGAHEGMCTGVLRNEWGLKGFVLSDSAWQTYMGVVDGLMAGNDCILSVIDLSNYNSARSNATVAKALRESTHRILYVIANSNAMNGMSANTRIYEVREWWQLLIQNVQLGVAGVTGVLALITALCFVFHKQIAAVVEPKEKERLKKKYERIDAQGSTSFGVKVKNLFCIGQPWHAKRILTTAISALLVVAIVFTSIYVPVSLTKNNQNGGGSGPVDTRKTYKFEAECAKVETNISNPVGTEGKTLEAVNYPSGEMFITGMKNATNMKVTFNVTASTAGKANLVMCMGLREWSMSFVNTLNLIVNDTPVTVDAGIIFPVYDGVKFFDWTEVEICDIDLVKGDNTIVIEKKAGLGDGVGNGLNFDYLTLKTDATLEWTHEVGVGHAYGDWALIEEPDVDTEGKIGARCTTCRELKIETMPVVSEANGYTKTADDGYGTVSWSYTAHGKTFTFTTVNEPEGAKDYKFEAECATLTKDSKVGVGTEGKGVVTTNYPSGDAFVSGIKNATTFAAEFRITADVASPAMLSACMGLREWELVMSNIFTLTVNGQEVSMADVIFPVMSTGGIKYWDWHSEQLAIINLQKGENVIKLEKKAGLGDGAGNGLNFDYLTVRSAANLQWTSEVGKGHTATDWTVVTEPTLTTEGTIATRCSTCREYITETIPSISVANGYIKTGSDSSAFGTATWSYNKDGNTFTFVTRNMPDGAKEYIYQAEGAIRTGTAKIYNDATCGASGDSYIGGLNSAEWTLTFNVTVDKACEALLIINVGRRNDIDVPLNNITMSLNGTQLSLPAITFGKIASSDKWHNYEEFEIMVVSLKAGKNVITLSNPNSNAFGNIDYFKFICTADAS